LGAKLLVCRTTGCDLTDAGRELLASLERIEGEFIASEARLAGRNAALSGAIRIGAPDGFGVFFLAPRIRRLIARKLTDYTLSLYATEEYLKTHGCPRVLRSWPRTGSSGMSRICCTRPHSRTVRSSGTVGRAVSRSAAPPASCRLSQPAPGSASVTTTSPRGNRRSSWSCLGSRSAGHTGSWCMRACATMQKFAPLRISSSPRYAAAA
jgi:hypothetical protein